MLVRMARRAAALRNAFLDFLFPPRCVACRHTGTDWFCAECRGQIVKVMPPICSRCGRPLVPPQTLCQFCKKSPLAIEGTRAVAFFEGTLRAAIHALKYNHRPELATPLGNLLHEYLHQESLPADALIPVPLHPQRERERGYNQAFLLTQILGEQAGLPVWNETLTRIRVTRSQVELNAIERHKNVKDAFTATARVANARILLIDDVCTTGATMEACGTALYRQGAKSVWGLALARSRLT
jgi:ComF family protein